MGPTRNHLGLLVLIIPICTPAKGELEAFRSAHAERLRSLEEVTIVYTWMRDADRASVVADWDESARFHEAELAKMQSDFDALLVGKPEAVQKQLRDQWERQQEQTADRSNAAVSHPDVIEYVSEFTGQLKIQLCPEPLRVRVDLIDQRQKPSVAFPALTPGMARLMDSRFESHTERFYSDSKLIEIRRSRNMLFQLPPNPAAHRDWVLVLTGVMVDLPSSTSMSRRGGVSTLSWRGRGTSHYLGLDGAAAKYRMELNDDEAMTISRVSAMRGDTVLREIRFDRYSAIQDTILPGYIEMQTYDESGKVMERRDVYTLQAVRPTPSAQGGKPGCEDVQVSPNMVVDRVQN